jgi:hypothetical protein
LGNKSGTTLLKHAGQLVSLSIAHSEVSLPTVRAIYTTLTTEGNALKTLEFEQREVPRGEEAEWMHQFAAALCHPNCGLKKLTLKIRVEPSGWDVLERAIRQPNCRLITLDAGYQARALSKTVRAQALLFALRSARRRDGPVRKLPKELIAMVGIFLY